MKPFIKLANCLTRTIQNAVSQFAVVFVEVRQLTTIQRPSSGEAPDGSACHMPSVNKDNMNRFGRFFLTRLYFDLAW